MDKENSSDIRYAKTFARYVRIAAWFTACLLLIWSVSKTVTLSDHWFPWLVWLTLGYTTVYAIWMIVPWVRFTSRRIWKTGMIGYLVLSFFFVFLMIGNIMVDAATAGAAGAKLGVPGFEGTLLFLSLAQIPGILFERHPEMMV